MRRMLFFTQGKFSGTNASVRNGLRKQFPQCDILCVDINRLLKGRLATVGANAAATVMCYGWDIMTRRRDLDDAFFGTGYIFRRVREMALGIQAEWHADCSFQTQSIFDCSSPNRPHFVYTDHTYLSCREYPVYGCHIWTPLRPEWLVALERGIYDRASCVFTMSTNVSDTLVRDYGVARDKVLCVRAGCNAAERALAKAPLGINRLASRGILFVGRDWELKGGPELLEAFRHVRGGFPDATLTVAGCSPRVRAPGVTVLGRVSLDRVADLYASAAVFCMPSKIEAFGIVFLEAMAAGLPVIALRLGAAPDFVIDGETGITVRPDDVAALADAMSRLLANPEECRRLGENGRQLVIEQYTWDHVCADMACRMREVVGR